MALRYLKVQGHLAAKGNAIPSNGWDQLLPPIRPIPVPETGGSQTFQGPSCDAGCIGSHREGALLKEFNLNLIKALDSFILIIFFQKMEITYSN